LITLARSSGSPPPSLITQLIEAGQPFWLDIENPTDETIDQLAARLGLHPLAVEDSKQFGQRAKLQVYGNGVMLEITAIRRQAAVTRRILIPGRDLAARTPLIHSLPGATSDTQLYAEDINDELQQVVADFTAIEERCAALLVLHASLASKHVAVVSRRLADVATIFLPISFLAGFWGQNFDVLTGSVEKDGRRS
jgi:Mg2+ and Co2+ transporter CorA